MLLNHPKLVNAGTAGMLSIFKEWSPTKERVLVERRTVSETASSFSLHHAPSAHKEDGCMSLRVPDPTAEGVPVIKTTTVEATTANEMTAAPGEALLMPDDRTLAVPIP
ncbi:hypothetical protein EW146_g7620 [Bondarzewia mesenterica]|uniref:Uncharacterized protein n=1 Tax=Bondarzewia mesenterica TaxID=1095465 RepID=A0A4S4LKV8_9AGAM|nr:hypothetical protein EW146_g7620 [Bondarzewia mesenterica]